MLKESKYLLLLNTNRNKTIETEVIYGKINKLFVWELCLQVERIILHLG